MAAPSTLEEAMKGMALNEAQIVTEPRPPFRIVYVNKAWCDLCGFTSEEALSRTPAILQGPSTCRVTLGLIEDSVAKGQSLSVELLNYKKDGTPFTNHLTLSPLFDPNRKLNYYHALIRANDDAHPEKECKILTKPEERATATVLSESQAKLAAAPAPAATAAPLANIRVPPFLTKLHALMSDESTNDIAGWSTAGTEICVHNSGVFAKQLLPRYFKHNKLGSFQQQLNIYDFKRETGVTYLNASIVWKHPNFQRDRKELLVHIKPRRSHSQASPKTGAQKFAAPVPRTPVGAQEALTSDVDACVGSSRNASVHGFGARAQMQPESAQLADGLPVRARTSRTIGGWCMRLTRCGSPLRPALVPSLSSRSCETPLTAW